jgi:hypothetical protein
MRKKRVIKEETSTIDIAIATALSQGQLSPSECEALNSMTMQELCGEHGLDYVLAEKVLVHARKEKARLIYQSQQTWDENETEGGFTRTHPIPESVTRKRIKRIIKEVASSFKSK